DTAYSTTTETRIGELSGADVAYIEFSKSPNGELKGVQVTHGAILTQCTGWMMSTGMLGIGRKYKHRVELEQSDDEHGSMHELDAALASEPLVPEPVDAANHAASGSLGKRWGGSTGFLGRLRNVGSLPRIRKNSASSTTSFRSSLAGPPQLARDRAGSAASARGSPSTMPRNPTRMSAVSAARSSPRSSHASDPAQRASEVVVSYIEPRQHFGLVYGILAGCFGGHQSVYTSSALCDLPGAYIGLLTRYRATVAVGDYTGLQS
ncbi:hypothetical protein EC988_008640, partial [Linderina pennispora]